MRQAAAIPLVLLVYVVFGLLGHSGQTISRHMEAEADWMALQTTRDPGATQSLWQRVAHSLGLSDPSPPTGPYLESSCTTAPVDGPAGGDGTWWVGGWRARASSGRPGASGSASGRFP